MKAEIFNPFIVATLDVLKTMANIRPDRGTPRLKDRTDVSYDVSGVIGLTGDVQGFVTLSFRESAALHVVSAFLGEPLNVVDSQVRDGVGELTNIVAGGAKRALSEAGYSLRISIPSVIVGHDHVISRPTGIPCFEIPFSTRAGPFSVELCLKSDP